MFRYLTIVSLAFVAASGLAQDAGGPGVLFKSEAGKFSVWLPSKPRSSTKTLKRPAGEVELRTFIVDEGVKGYYVAYTDYAPGSVTDDVRSELLDKIRDGGAAAVQGRAVGETKITLGKQRLDGRDFLIEYPNRVGRARIFLQGDRLYQLVVSGPSKEWTTSAAVTRFFESFAIEE